MSAAAPVAAAPIARAPGLARWWPLAALTLLAAALRFSTLDLQSLWFDEAFTPVHVLHTSLSATLRAMVHSENSPPLWYVIAWLDARVLGDGALALRLPSAIAGVATVPVAWAIGAELAGRRAAVLTAALVAVNPLFVWYSQEARAYALFVLTASLAMLCFLRAQSQPTPGRLAAFALTGSLALLSHYFAVFLLIGMVLWLIGRPASRRLSLPAVAALGIVGLALLPLIVAQGGHGTQWIGRWALSSRLAAIPQYYLTGYSGAPLGHGVELLVALLLLAGVGLGAWCMLGEGRTSPARLAPGTAGALVAGEGGELDGRRSERRGALLALLLATSGVLCPIALAVFGADYLAPRNLVAAMIAVTALLAVLLAATERGSADARRAGTALAAAIVLAFLALSVDVDLSPRLQRGNWRDVARALGPGAGDRVITTVELGAAPLEYYLAPLRNLPRGASVAVSEIDETGYAPLRASAERLPAPGFRLVARLNIDGLIVYRFVSPLPRAVEEATLRRHVITRAHPEVLVPAGARVAARGARVAARPGRVAARPGRVPAGGI